MTIRFTTGDIFAQRTQAIVNPVNCVGVMGRGLALQFKRRHPDAFLAYRDACAHGRVKPGRVFTFATALHSPRWILHFPTKRHWREPSTIVDIRTGLADLAATLARHRIGSVAIPPLGCGLGGLDWRDVRPLIAHALAGVDADVVVLRPATTAQPAPAAGFLPPPTA